MLNLYDTKMSPGATVVKLLTGRRPVGTSNRDASRSTQSQLLFLVDPIDELSACSDKEHGVEHDLQVA